MKRRETMKRLFAFLLACVCALALFGCARANDDKSDGGPEDDATPLTEAQIEEFKEMFALTQSLPGVFAVNISIFVGYKLYKVGGSLVCALATILPSFVIMMLIAMFFARFQDNEVMIRIFNGIRPAVVALILFPCISAVRALKLKYLQLVAPAIATLLIWQFGLSPIYIVLAGILGGLVYTLWLKEKIMNKEV